MLEPIVFHFLVIILYLCVSKTPVTDRRGGLCLWACIVQVKRVDGSHLAPIRSRTSLRMASYCQSAVARTTVILKHSGFLSFKERFLLRIVLLSLQFHYPPAWWISLTLTGLTTTLRFRWVGDRWNQMEMKSMILLSNDLRSSKWSYL